MAAADFPSLSVVIPTFNCGSFLPGALASVRAQQWPQLEIIVVDDGSTDDTAAQLEPMAARGELVFLRRQNSGPSAAKNAGIRAATGKYVVFLDADDAWAPGAFHSLWSVIQAGPSLRWSFTDVVRAYPDHDELRAGPYPQGDPLRALLRDNFIQRGGLTERALLLDIGLFDESLRVFEDWDLYLRLFQAGALGAYLPGSWYRYTVRGDSITRDHRLLVESRERLVRKHHRGLARSGGPDFRALYAHQLWKLAREYHYTLRRHGKALRLLAESLRWDFAPGRLLRAAGVLPRDGR